MPHETDKPFDWPSLMEVPPHVGIAASDHALRVLLEAPADLPLVQWQIAPLDTVDRRLAGCVWQLVGCLVPLTDDHPDYPFLQYQAPPIRLQVWLWRVSQPPPQTRRVSRPPQMRCGELRWHPEKGRSAAIVGLLPGDGRAEVLRVWQWLNTSKRFSGGRPHGGPFRNATHCRAYLRRLADTCEKKDWPITKERLGQLAMDGQYIRTEDPISAAKTISRWCKRYQIDFDREIKRDSWP